MAGAAVRDVEICCDDAVLAKASLDDRAKYSQTILQTAESGERMAFIPQFYTGGQGLILRLRAIFDTHPRRHGAAALTAVILAAAFSGGCFRPVSIPAAEIDETEYVLYESSGTQEKAKKPSSTAAPPDKATEIVAYFLAETHPGAALRSQMGTTEEGESYISCLIFETENLKFLPAEIASARINFIPETNFSAYKSGLLPHTPGEREIRCPLDGWRATASYHPDCGIALAKTMDRLMDGEFLLDASLRLPLELASWHGAFQLFSGDEASEPLHAMTGDGELCAVMLKRFQEARPDSVSETLEKKGAYQLMNLYARNSGGTWKGFSMRFYKTENAVEILALDGSFEKRYTFKKQDAWIACFLEDVTGKLAVLPPAPALSAKAAAEKIVSFARSPELKLGALSGDAAQTGWLMKKSYVEGARQLLLNIQPETLAECDPLSERIGGLQMENNHETIDLWLLDTPVPTVEYAVSGTLTPARHYYALSGGEKPFLVLLNYLQRTNQMLWDSSETVTTEDTDPQRVGRLLFEAYRSSRSSYDTLEEFRMPGATVMGTRLIGGDLNHFAVEIEYRDDADRWAFQVLRGRREDRTQYRLIKLFPERNDFVYSPPVDVATEDKIREAMESLENPDAYHWDNLTDVYAASLLDGVLTGSGRLEGFLWRAAKNESDCLRVLAPPYAYEVWTQENGQGCVIVYQADGSWKRYDTAEPFSLTENGYIIGQTLSGPGLPLVLPEN